MEGERKGSGKGAEGDGFDLDPSTMNAKGKKKYFFRAAISKHF